jgi:uncharacterized protein (TIGR00255 family)
MNSMTGYGRASGPLGTYTLTIQVSSVNRKTLDLTVKAPGAWEALEPAVGEQVRKVAVRGKVHVDLELTGTKGADSVVWDEVAAAETIDRLASFAEKQGVDFKPTPELLLQILNSQRVASGLPSADEAAPHVTALLGEALRGFAAMRAREGEALLVDFLTRLTTLGRHIQAVAERAPRVPTAYREQLHKRLREAGLELDLADDRVLKEIALFADRCDVTEELTRLRSHLSQFEALLKSGAEMGRKAEFILQEIGREVHTIGSKANDLDVSRHVIELKNELERIREQIANVE